MELEPLLDLTVHVNTLIKSPLSMVVVKQAAEIVTDAYLLHRCQTFISAIRVLCD